MNRNEETHKIYGYVTEDEFYAGLNEAKKENLFVDEKGWVDIGALLSAMWKVFGEGRMVVVPKEGFKRPEVKPIRELDGSVTIEERPLLEVNSKEEMPEINKDGMAVVKFDPPKKRPPRSKKVKEETAEQVTE